MTPTDLAARRRLAKAAAILNDPDHPQHTLLADLVDTAIALDPPEGWVATPECSRCNDKRLVYADPALGASRYGPILMVCPDCREVAAEFTDPDPCPPSGIARPRRGGLIVVVP